MLEILKSLWDLIWRLCVVMTIGLLGILEYVDFVKFCIEHEINGWGFHFLKTVIVLTIIGGLIYFAVDWKYFIERYKKRKAK